MSTSRQAGAATPGFVYMIREREFVLQDMSRCKCKIGRARDFLTRSGHYPRGSEILVVLPCDSMLDTENAIKAAMCEAGFRWLGKAQPRPKAAKVRRDRKRDIRG